MGDFKYSFRTLLKRPGFTIVAVVTLALGIGVNTAIFSLINALVFRPLPLESLNRLVQVYNTGRQIVFLNHLPLSMPDYRDYRDQNEVFTGLAAYNTSPAILGSGEDAEMSGGETVSGNFFEVIGTKPAIGRLLGPEDDKPDAPLVAVISHSTWRRRFNADPSILGRTIKLNGQDFVVIGVASEEFKGMLRVLSSEFWIPMSSLPSMVPKEMANLLQDRATNQFSAIGRLKPGVTVEQAAANLQTIAKQLEQAYPKSNMDRSATAIPRGDIIFDPSIDGYIKAASGIVMALSGIVLLIACANLANLMLARALGRRKELAIRLALGGTRGRLMGHVLAESVILAVAGGAAGLLIAVWCNRVLNVIELPIPVEVAFGLNLDGRVVAFAFFASLATGIVFGILPAWRAARADAFPALKDEGGSHSGGHRRALLRNGLVVAQVTLSLVLLIFAGLAVRSLQNAGMVDPGFNPDQMAVGSFDLGLHRVAPERGLLIFRDLVDRLKSTPGIESASLVTNTPLSLGVRLTRIALRGDTPESEATLMDTTYVWPGYFATMGIPILKGRDFAETDNDSAPRVVIVNEAFAKAYWPNEDPIGKQVFAGFPSLKALQVVGIAQNGKYRTLGEDPRPFLYSNLVQTYQGSVNVIVRSAGGSSAGIAAIRSTMQSIDPTLPVHTLRSMRERIGTSLLLPQYVAGLFGTFGLLGAALAIVGLYGVISYSVSQRTQEMGIRMALGGSRRDVLRLVLGEGMKLTVMGIALGVLIAAASSRLLSAILYGIGTLDPVTFLGISGLMIVVTLIACYIPARRATQVSPMIALRQL